MIAARPEGSGGRLEGKVAIITGAAAGIGRATALRFAREGARLVLADRDEATLGGLKEELDADGATAEVIRADTSVVEDVQRIVGAGMCSFGRVDVLVANAGVMVMADVLDETGEGWDRIHATNSRGTFLSCKHAIEAMRGSGGGSIVCVSSISGLRGQGGQVAYGSTKFAVAGLTRHLAIEWADRGIRVNAVAPGAIRTEGLRALVNARRAPEGRARVDPQRLSHAVLAMGRRARDRRERRRGQDPLDRLGGLHPVGRLGEPDEVAAAIVFLASDEASFITGTVLPVDGGYLAQ
jgi:NAD(P)-dependent dehydrogenase (short-subunit alcohol dehydrogenase family)